MRGFLPQTTPRSPNPDSGVLQIVCSAECPMMHFGVFTSDETKGRTILITTSLEHRQQPRGGLFSLILPAIPKNRMAEAISSYRDGRLVIGFERFAAGLFLIDADVHSRWRSLTNCFA
jgi:hypothetical protein